MQSIGLLIIIVMQVACVIDAIRRGYPVQFVALIMFFPLLGPIAYFLIEIVPDLYYTRVRPLFKKLTFKKDPYQEMIVLQQAVKRSPSIENRHRLALIYLQIGQCKEALDLLDSLLADHFANDPFLLFDKAQVLFEMKEYHQALFILKFLMEENPQFQISQVRLLNARTLAQLGEIQLAVAEFERLENHYSGLESSFYFLQFLKKINNYPRAIEIFRQMQQRYNRFPRHFRAEQKAWMSQAENDLK